MFFGYLWSSVVTAFCPFAKNTCSGWSFAKKRCARLTVYRIVVDLSTNGPEAWKGIFSLLCDSWNVIHFAGYVRIA